jgi:predicted molibdopterin-dependent oxidoreductase YjgC
MSLETLNFVDSLEAVGSVSKRIADKTGKVSVQTVRNVAKVITNEGRKGIAVSHTGKNGHVTVRYLEACPGDIEGLRCIADGEMRQHYETELTVVVDNSPETQTDLEAK